MLHSRHAFGLLEKFYILDIGTDSWPLEGCVTFLLVGLCVHHASIKHASGLHQCRRRDMQDCHSVFGGTICSYEMDENPSCPR